MYVLALLLLWIAAAAAAPFDGQTAKDFLDTLCSPQFAGRKSGDPEMARCERWAADNFERFGLDPCGKETYLLPFPILCNREEKASLELVNGYHGRKRYQNGEDFHLITNSGSGKVKAEVVFCGYGIAEPEKGWNDFAGVDLKGKVALIYKAVPAPERIWKEQLTRDYKLKRAVERGASAVIFVHDPYAISGAAIHKEAFYPNAPVMIISEHVMEDFFRGTGKRWSNVKKELEKAPQSFATGHLVKIETRLKHHPDAQAANVIGVLPGSDPKLKDEWIVIGGHLDHNGVNAEGDVFYGADDNGSGAAIILELARRFASAFPTPKRSLMFIEFAGEEQGLLGSQWFVDHPAVPLEKIAAMFNFDCCGMGSGGVGFGGAEHFPEIWESYQAQMDSTAKANLTVSTIWHGGSDNTSFQDKGVPTFNYWSSGDRPFYHHQEDLPALISPATLGKVGQEASNFIEYLANWEKPLITEDYKVRTWLYSAYGFWAFPLGKSRSGKGGDWVESCKGAHQSGTKFVMVSIGAEDPYGDVDYWKKSCEELGFSWATGKDAIRTAVRKHKLALLPVISELEGLDSAGIQLRNLAAMGVKVVYLGTAKSDCVKLKGMIRQAGDLEMVFLVNSDLACLIPEKCKKAVLLQPGSLAIPLPNKDQLDNVRLVYLRQESLNSDSLGIVKQVAVLCHYGETFHRDLLELEKAGFTGQDIVYMLGENLLEILP